jgi:nucleoside-diphosphate-sugar epimerase
MRTQCLILDVYIVILTLLLPTSHAAVLVIGATGRTGSLLYKELKDQHGIDNVRALVRSVEKARELLHCEACDPTEGVFLGDVTDVTTLMPALRGVHSLAIAAGASTKSTAEEIKEIEFTGVQNAVQALAQEANRKQFGLQNLKVVLCSSQGSTWFPSNNTFGQIIFQKLL